ncbi:MAG: tetratricopeptide repeat protein [Planctomycetota bacterium]|jgi:Flp pilus assembly protein TadD|nr:tetratricopeptide repeat protein [Planctomycetota bacterium]MDP6989376.1 tetratricopeptide repeat protein [Planctomycetota bacterium]
MTDTSKEHYLAGLALFGEQKHTEAIEAYRKALEVAPDDPEVLLALATAQMNAGLLDDAVESGKRVVELDGEDPFGHTSLSMIYMRKGMIEEAEKEQATARMLSWRRDLAENPDAPPPPTGGIDVVQ